MMTANHTRKATALAGADHIDVLGVFENIHQYFVARFQYGSGVFTSTDGLNWTPFNTGLTSTDNSDFRSSGPDSMVVIGNDVYLSTTDGKIWEYSTVVPEPGMMGLLALGSLMLSCRRRRCGIFAQVRLRM